MPFDEIARGYDNYFRAVPYRTWFGKEEGGKVEAFLNGFGASFYSNATRYVGIHIDLFPFATQSDYASISHLAERDLFSTQWAVSFLDRLLGFLKPEAIIVAGALNRRSSDKLDGFINWTSSEQYNGPTVPTIHLGLVGGRNIPAAAVSINLGNPVKWGRKELILFGSYVRKKLGLT